MAQNTFYWYDYETFGTDPRRDRISQFAGIRTDEDLNIISAPLDIYCKAADDMLPQPEACLITGITPQKTITDGLIEAEFIAAIDQEFSTPNTCVVGFNNIRFDDEFTRYTLYRNFYDAYAREWQNGNSRWDIIDLVRVTRALRPDGIEWPVDDEGKASNRLELITKANGISHEAAHDAMSDVYATIAVAKLIKQKQPRLYDYILNNKQKHKVMQMLNMVKPVPVLHTSGMYSSDICNTAMIYPLALHPINKNGIIVYDLRYDPQALIDLDAKTIRENIYTPKDELPENVARIPIKTVHINKCPVLVPLNTLDDASAQRIDINRQQHQQHLEKLQHASGLTKKVQEVFKENNFEPISDPEQSLYSGGFFSNEDRQRMDQIRHTPASELAHLQMNFDDERIPELLFRYRARNFPASLSPEQQQQWQSYRKKRLTDPDGGGSITLDNYLLRLDELIQSGLYSEQQMKLLDELKKYGQQLQQSLA
ncbi:MAG: exodeoxyribonuclease I [Gammaproteobacteria bacterium]|nr:exodeoxyribonuclease I [Gammaproteobacteria bacterium]